MRDFLQASDGDLDLTGGDIQMVDATLQHARDIILTRPGEMKHSPARGVGIEEYFNDDNTDDMLRRIRQEASKDGMRVVSIAGTNGQIQMKGYYETDFNR